MLQWIYFRVRLIPTYLLKTNILLFDESVFPRASLYTLRDIDYVFTRTDEITTLLQDSVSKDKLINIGWRSTDLNSNFQDRDYNKCLLFCYDNKQASLYQKIINTWNNDERLNEGWSYSSCCKFRTTNVKESDITNDYWKRYYRKSLKVFLIHIPPYV